MSDGDTCRPVCGLFLFFCFLRLRNAFTDTRAPFRYHLSAVPAIEKNKCQT
nr:MAG TPA: hypothetical protein [Caudoviricetes sp.]